MRWLCLLWLPLLWLGACGVSPGHEASLPAPERRDSSLWQAQTFSGNWTYRLGASPQLASGVALYAQPDFADLDWQQPTRLGQAPLEYGQREMWMRVKLVGPQLKSPTLFLPLAGYANAYLDGHPITMEELPHHPLEEQRSHDRRFLIHLSPQYVGQLLCIHLQSNAPRIGVTSAPYLGEPMGVMGQLLRNAAFLIVVTVLTGILALAALALFLAIRQQIILLHFALICLCLCAYFAGLSGLLGWIFRSPPPSNTLYNLAAPLIIASIQAFIIRVLGQDRFRLLYLPVTALLLCSTVELIAISLRGVQVLDRMLRPVNLLIIVSFFLVIYRLARSARAGDIDARIISGGLILASFTVLPDTLTLAGVWIRSTQYVLLQVGCSLFLISLGMVPIRRFMETHRQLSRLTQLQAAQVEMLERRNTEIQSLNDELRRQIEQRSDRMTELLTRSSSGQTVAPVQELAPGDLLGEHYRVIRPLGRGAMGSVYEVERTTDRLHLAAKLLSTHSERSAMLRFIREARILAQLQHPNLVSITDIDISQNGVLFLVMELVKGTTLREAKAHYGELRFARSVLRQLCLGLKAIHDSGFVHRDLKPANVLISETPTGFIAKIADFGISTLEKRIPQPETATDPQKLAPQLAALADSAAELPEQTADLDAAAPESGGVTAGEEEPLCESPFAGLGSVEELTRTGALLGTPLYMAPELASGSRRAAPASDIFSFGVIAFELISGKLPYSVPPVVAVWHRRAAATTPLKTAQPAVSDELAALVDRCLASDPATRPTLPELIAALTER